MHFSSLRAHIKWTKCAPLIVPPQQQEKVQFGPCISQSELSILYQR